MAFFPQQGAEKILPVHVLFARRAHENPDAIAVVCGEKHLSYRELNRRADRLAGRLRSMQVRPESRVAICLGRAAEMVVAMLATLKTGAAYVPLDPAYPQERLEFMLTDSDAQVIVTESGMGTLAGGRIPALMVAEHEEPGPTNTTDNSGPEPVPGEARNLAWIIYTSGSTGRPKGVGIEHGSAVALVNWSEEVFTAEEMSGVLAATSWCFDLSAFEIWAPLLRGGTAIIVDNVLELESMISRDQVRLINSVPVAVLELVTRGGIPKSVQTVNLAGEPLTRELVDKLYALPHIMRVLNLYGPTEDTTYSTWAEMKRGERGSPSIGVAITGSSTCVLDESGDPVPAGVIGELYLGGAGLARGYVGHPAATAEKFVPNPHDQRGGERLYRTGDLVRSLPDGSLEFIGRVDHQVKLRGLRVELGEIEMTLKKHDRVGDALVMAWEKDGEKHLVGYVVASKNGAGGAGAQVQREADEKLGRQLQDYVRGLLPQFMVPSAIVVLSVWPLTLNGKIDRKRLPEPQFSSSSSLYVAPRTPVEESVAAIWKEVLKTDKLSVEDSFFHLGGHSLAAARIITRVREKFGFQLPIQKVLENATIAQLSSLIETRLSPVKKQAVESVGSFQELPLRPVVQGALLRLSYSQQRMWLSVQMNPDSTGFNVFMPLRWSGPFSFRAAKQAFSEIIRRHSAFRCTFHLSGGRPVQRVHPHVPIMIQEIDLSGLDKEKRRAEAMRLALEEGGRLFDLEKDMLVRIAHLHLARNEEILLITTHHIATDLVSAGLFGSEFSLLYQTMCEGRPSPLPELKIQYSDYAYWQREWLSGPAFDYQREYWQKQLEWAPRKPLLQPDRPRSAKPSMNGKYHSFDTSPEIYSALAALGSNESATIYMTVLAAFKALLYRVSGETDWVVGTDVANRTQPHTESLIGFFVNVLALRTKISPGMTFRQLLRKVRQTALEGYAHQDLPFEEVIKITGRDEVSSPLFQVFFVVQHETGDLMSIPDVNVSRLAFDNNSAVRELSLYSWAVNGGLHLAWNYRTELFELSTIQRWTKNLLALIENVVRNPDLALEEIDLTPQVPVHTAGKSSFQLAQAKFQAVKPKAVSVGPGNKR